MERATLSAEEAAKYIGIGRNKIYELLNDRVIPSIRIGRRFLIPKLALDAWLAEKSV